METFPLQIMTESMNENITTNLAIHSNFITHIMFFGRDGLIEFSHLLGINSTEMGWIGFQIMKILFHSYQVK